MFTSDQHNAKRAQAVKNRDLSVLNISENLWQAKSFHGVRYYQSVEALVAYFGTAEPVGYVVTKYSRQH